MKLDTFISNVLNDIETGLRTAEDTTGKKHFITSTSGNAGVSFDIAVIARDENSTAAGGTAEGTVKAGLKVTFVEVVGAIVGGKVESVRGPWSCVTVWVSPAEMPGDLGSIPFSEAARAEVPGSSHKRTLLRQKGKRPATT